MRVLVIGASGFIGSAVTRALAARGDVQVRAGMRNPGRASFDSSVEIRQLDSNDKTMLAAAISDVTHVVDCVMGSAATMTGTSANLAAAARSSGLRRVVTLSSCAVYGSAQGYVDEATPLCEPSDDYAAAKVECERILLDAGGHGLSSVILRPSCVYGPGSQQWTVRIAKMLIARRLGDLGQAGEGTANLVAVDDLVSAILAGLELPGEGTDIFNISNASPGTWNAYLMAFARMLGAIPVRRIPSWQLRLDGKLAAPPLKVAQILRDRLKLTGVQIADPITPSMLRLFAHQVQFGSHKADRLSSFHRTPLQEGLASAALWFKEHFV